MSISQSSPTVPVAPPQDTPIVSTNAAISAHSHQLPKTMTRTIGQHARLLGFEWNKRADQHKYRTGLGLPEVHAAIINEDWDTALELMGPDDLGLMWLPPFSQRAPSKGADSHFSRWASLLPSTDTDKQRQAIIEMVSDHVSTTTLDTNVIAYGANLLTLALLKPARKDVQEKIFQMALKHQSPYLRLPDGSGRAPLWVAVDKGNLDCIEMILKSGANAAEACIFPADGANEQPLVWAATRNSREIFALCLHSVMNEFECNNHYPIKSDPLKIRRWAQRSSEEDIRWLATKFPKLRNILFSLPDQTGTSLLLRAIRSGSLEQIGDLPTPKAKLAEGFFCFDPLIPRDLRIGPSIMPLLQAAITSPVALYSALLSEAKVNTAYMQGGSPEASQAWMTILFSERGFFAYRSDEDIAQLTSDHRFSTDIMNRQGDPLDQQISDKYRHIIRAVWPVLDSHEKLEVFVNTADKDDGRTEFVLGLLDVSLNEEALQKMMRRAFKAGNRTAFEYAAERSLMVGRIFDELSTRTESAQAAAAGLAYSALRVGSLKWFDKLLKDGVDLQRVLDTDFDAVALLSDLDPDGLHDRLRSVRCQIDEDMIESTHTEAGRKALVAIQQANPKQ